MAIKESVTVADEVTGKTMTAWFRQVGEDVVVVIGGGQRPHVGCVVLAAPHPSKAASKSSTASCSVLTIPPHKEEPIARGVAVRLAEDLGRVTVVTAGVHDDDLDRAGIEVYLDLAKRLSEELSRSIGGHRCPS
jgi:hypothetical protein